MLENDSGCHAGTVAEADGVLETADDKLLLHTLSGALIADMESAAIAEACQGAGRPLLVVRAISDRVATRIPHCALVAVAANGDVKLARCLGSLLLAPGDSAGASTPGEGIPCSLRGAVRSRAAGWSRIPAPAGGTRRGPMNNSGQDPPTVVTPGRR